MWWVWHLCLGVLLGHAGSQWLSYHYVTFSLINRMIIMKLDKLLEKGKCSRFKRKPHQQNTSLHHLLSHLDLGHLLKLLQSLSQLQENTRHRHTHHSVKDEKDLTNPTDSTISEHLETVDLKPHKLDHTNPSDIHSKTSAECKCDSNLCETDSTSEKKSVLPIISITPPETDVSIQEEIVTDPSQPPSTLRFKKPLRRPTLTLVQT